MPELCRENRSARGHLGHKNLTHGTIVERLEFARRIADYATELGVSPTESERRPALTHLGAVLADAVLQAGLNYRTVVYRRVLRIHTTYPEAAKLSGLLPIVERGDVADFLLWKHATKIERFTSLVNFVALAQIDTTDALHEWLLLDNSRDSLLSLDGVGPKTFDYICCLVGIDCIPVDRHIRTFASAAGVTTSDYLHLGAVMALAADLLGIARRDFDSWVWNTVSRQPHALAA